jgi:hypothetical protein
MPKVATSLQYNNSDLLRKVEEGHPNVERTRLAKEVAEACRWRSLPFAIDVWRRYSLRKAESAAVLAFFATIALLCCWTRRAILKVLVLGAAKRA